MRVPRRPVATARVLARTYGARGLVRRIVHETRRRFGWFHAGPALRVSGPRDVPNDVYAPSENWSRIGEARAAELVERGRRVAAGEYQAFGAEWRRMPASAREWRTHFQSKYEFANAPWWTISHLPPQADIKDVWEPARFAWAYDLIRAYRLTGERTFGDAFHAVLRSWLESSEPFRGVHWSCGQETAIRALALLHAEAGLPLPEHEAEEASERLRSVLLWSAERIADAIGYGASQRNNHGISEAAGLIHVGMRFRAVEARASAWIATGRRVLEEQIRDQFSPDGWYAQHSFNYMRLALDQILVTQRTLLRAGESLSATALQRVDAALALITAVVDRDTGVVPNHGANDGARVLPLSASAHRDFRPLLTLGAVVRSRGLPADVRPDGEVLCWLGADLAAPEPPRGDVALSGPSGWAVARVGDATVFLRAGVYRHRPSHLDVLHADIRFGSQEVVVDPGTYSYNAPAPWANGLASAHVHNGPVINDAEPAERGPRFLWYSWPVARVRAAELVSGMATLTAEMPGIVVRTLEVAPGRVTVSDDVVGAGANTVQVTWLVHPSIHASTPVITGDDFDVIQARADSTDAWFSPTYDVKLPTHAYRARLKTTAERRTIRSVIHEPAGEGERP